jgi:hypothetical protein
MTSGKSFVTDVLFGIRVELGSARIRRISNITPRGDTDFFDLLFCVSVTDSPRIRIEVWTFFTTGPLFAIPIGMTMLLISNLDDEVGRRHAIETGVVTTNKYFSRDDPLWS